MPTQKPIAGSDALRPLKTEQDEWRYNPTPRRQPRAAPTVGIFDAPTRCVQINKEWWSHVSGMIDVLSTPDMWEGDEDERTRAIREIADLLSVENCEMSMDYDQLMEAIAAGIYKAGNNFAKQIVSGRTTNIAVGDDGAVSDPTEGSVEPETPIEDNPTTPINETLAAKAGGCISIRLYLQSICDAMASYNTTGVTQADASIRLQNLYGFATAPADAYAAYYYTTAITPTVAPILVEALSETLFCRSLSVQSLFYYLYQLHPPANINERTELEKMFLCVTPAILSDWYELGTVTPSTDFIAWPCTTIPVEEFDLNMSTANLVEYTTSGIWKKGHRYQIDITGTFTDSDNPGITYDGSYKIVTSTGIKTYWPIIFTGVSLPTNPDQDNIPYSPAHIYSFTQDVPKTATNGTVKIGKDNGDFALPNTTGILHFKVTDLGQYSV